MHACTCIAMSTSMLLFIVLLTLAAAVEDRELRFVASLHHSTEAREWLEREFLRRTNPSNAEFRQFLPVHDIKAKMAPPAFEVARIQRWFEQHDTNRDDFIDEAEATPTQSEYPALALTRAHRRHNGKC